MRKLKIIIGLSCIALLISACTISSHFIIENKSDHIIEIKYSGWPPDKIIEPRIGNMRDVKKAEYRMDKLPISKYELSKDNKEYTVRMNPGESIVIGEMNSGFIVHPIDNFSKAIISITTPEGYIEYRGAEILKLFKEKGTMQYVYIYQKSA
jgi:hypothetical protein